MSNPTHSVIGASSAERFMNCPGSVREVALCPKQPESEYAKEGTAAHKLAELCLRTDAPAIISPFGKVGELLLGVKVTQEMAEAVQAYVDVIEEDLRQYKLTKHDLQVERKFHLTHIHENAYGTNDANLPVFLTKVIVYDFKYGSGVAVDAEDNKQAMYYALGAAVEGDYEEFEIVIVQPRAIHKGGPVRRWTISKADLEVFARDLKFFIEETEKPDALLQCGPWCKKTFCPALVKCPEARKDMQDAALVAFDAQPVAVPLKPEDLTPKQLRRLLDMMPIIDTWLKSVEAYALDLANKGGEVEGYKLVARKSNRKWQDEAKVKEVFGKAAIRVVEEMLSPSQLETELKKLTTLKDAKAKVEPFTFKPDAGNTLVPNTDPREAVQPKLEQTFSDTANDSLFE